jgi:hypothetical protein
LIIIIIVIIVIINNNNNITRALKPPQILPATNVQHLKNEGQERQPHGGELVQVHHRRLARGETCVRAVLQLPPLQHNSIRYLRRHAQITHDERSKWNALERSQAAANKNLYKERYGCCRSKHETSNEIAFAHVNGLGALAVENIRHGCCWLYCGCSTGTILSAAGGLAAEDHYCCADNQPSTITIELPPALCCCCFCSQRRRRRCIAIDTLTR